MELARGASARDTIVGVALSPAHFPFFSDRDFNVFFDEAAQIGSHVTWIFQWGSPPPAGSFAAVQGWAKQRGLKCQLWLSPTTLSNERKEPDLPKSLVGKSFADADVRRAYVDEVTELAALKPDVLGLATEINFLAENPSEFASFVSLANEAYVAVKKKYPQQTVTISFQWEVMRASAVRHAQGICQQHRRLLADQLSRCLRRSFQSEGARRLLLIGAQVSSDPARRDFRNRMEFRTACQ
jgi:hypothetical protein